MRRTALVLVTALALLALLTYRELLPTNRTDPEPPVSSQLADTESSTTTQPAACGTPTTKIHAVQGLGTASPMVGASVTIEGVVVGDFQRNDGDPYGTNLGGFFVQEEDEDADNDPNTSEGIYVYHWDTDVSVGNLVRVTGRVQEFHGLTQLGWVSDVVVCESNVALPSPAVIEFPLDNALSLEAFEGMLVTFPQELVISEYFNYDRFGEVVLAWPAGNAPRVRQPTALFDPEDPAIEYYLDLMARSRITLDDGITDQNPAVMRHPDGGLFTLEHRFRGGDRLKNLTGVLDYSFDSYRVQPVLGAEYIAANPRPHEPDDVGGSLRAAAFNVLNYFVTLTTAGDVCGPSANMECRGADSPEELRRQRDKIVAALHAVDAHVVGLIEIENDRDQAALADLVASLNAVAGAGTYAYVNTGGPVGSDAIKVALIYQPAALKSVGAPVVLDSREFLDPINSGHDRNRAALAQTFEEVTSGERFTVVVNHFKSKGSPCGEEGENVVVGSCNLTRLLAARALLAWLTTDPTGADDPDYLLLGDFNSYSREEPIRALLAGPDGILGTADDYTDLLYEFVGEDAYTFVFDGQVGSLDYALANASLLPQVSGATAWHINADEPDILDYGLRHKSAAQAELYAPDPFRSSDHDPVIVGLSLGEVSLVSPPSSPPRSRPGGSAR